MQVKKKYNRGGVIKSWPPDTEVMTSDNTAVSAPKLNFLANQLMPARPRFSRLCEGYEYAQVRDEKIRGSDPSSC